MIQNIVITDRNFDNEPWYALVLKRDNPSKSVVLVKIEMEDVGKFVLWLDPSSASHGSLNIRNFHVCKVGEDLYKIFYEALNEACFSASEDKIFRSYLPQRQAYPSALGLLIKNFPKSDLQYFASISIKRAFEEINGDHHTQTAREKELEAKYNALVNRLKAKKKKKKTKPTY